jgi:hypothetical protein
MAYRSAGLAIWLLAHGVASHAGVIGRTSMPAMTAVRVEPLDNGRPAGWDGSAPLPGASSDDGERPAFPSRGTLALAIGGVLMLAGLARRRPL